jgi:ubiquitin-conjugating enzyme E2 J2
MTSEQFSLKRLNGEYANFKASPPDYIIARPDPSNMHLWYFVVTGPPGTPYAGGQYLGKIRFPERYPMAPPSVMMVTPSGRFATETRLCLSMTDFHPEMWNPMWTTSSVLTGLLSFMCEETATTGSIETTSAVKRQLAIASREFNRQCPLYLRHFPDLVVVQEVPVVASLQSPSPGSPVVATVLSTPPGADGMEPPKNRPANEEDFDERSVSRGWTRYGAWLFFAAFVAVGMLHAMMYNAARVRLV